jgi:ketol-acid reductoisomerase
MEISKDWEIDAIDEAVNYYETVFTEIKDWKEQKTVEEKIKNLMKRKLELINK